jgi:hypothetical protein
MEIGEASLKWVTDNWSTFDWVILVADATPLMVLIRATRWISRLNVYTCIYSRLSADKIYIPVERISILPCRMSDCTSAAETASPTQKTVGKEGEREQSS